MFVDGMHQREDRHAGRPLIRISGIGSRGKKLLGTCSQERICIWRREMPRGRKRERMKIYMMLWMIDGCFVVSLSPY